MLNSSNSIEDLKELQEYLKNKYNINVYLNESKKINIIKKIEDVYLRLFFLIIFTIIIYILYIIIKNINLFSYVKIILYILFIFIIIYIVFLLQKYIFMIYFYNKNYNFYDETSINYNNINFETGDILQEVSNWNYSYGFLLYLFPLDFLHNIFIIKFKNKNYILHYTNDNFGYPKNILSFDSKHMEIFLLEDYLINNHHSTKYYRFFKSKKELDNEKIFDFLKNLNMNDLKFSYLPCIKNCKNTSNNYNCMSFILKILNYLKIIPDFNFYNFTSNDLIYLPRLSNNIYNNSIMIKIDK
jgi:hypothetical protein